MTECYIQIEDDKPVECDYCGWEGRGFELDSVSDIQERIYPGEICPAGQCPECGALAHLKTAPKAHYKPWRDEDLAAPWYVSMTWHDFPQGGSYGAVVTARNAEEAEKACRFEMAEAEFTDGECGRSLADVVEEYKDEWHIIDCFPLQQFINQHEFRDSPNYQPWLDSDMPSWHRMHKEREPAQSPPPGKFTIYTVTTDDRGGTETYVFLTEDEQSEFALDWCEQHWNEDEDGPMPDSWGEAYDMIRDGENYMWVEDHWFDLTPPQPPEDPFKVDMRCSQCGSEDVRADADAEWGQACNACGAEDLTIEEVYADEDVPWSLDDLFQWRIDNARRQPGFSQLT